MMGNKVEHLLDVRNLSIEFHGGRGITRAVKGVSFHLNKGETLGILGESGSGKSVSTSAIMGLLDQPPARITSGEVLFDGVDLLQIPERARRDINGRRIAMVFQDPAAYLNPVQKVGKQIMEMMTLHGVSRHEARERTLELAKRVRIPDASKRLDAYPHQFSGGQRQRLMIAMALAMKPEILIADEPTTALDVTVQSEIIELLVELREEMGLAMIMISHDLGLVSKVADRLLVMKDGEIVEQGVSEAIVKAPSHPYTRKLLQAVPGQVRKDASRPDGDPLLKVRNLAQTYGTVQVLKDISFDLHSGETVAVVGESGSGKSTLTRSLLMMEKPSHGTIHLDKQDLVNATAAERGQVRRRMQMIFQDPGQSLNPRWSVSAIISEPWRIHRDVLPPNRHRDRIVELLELVGLSAEHATRHAGQFSGGQKQRIAIARALALNPEILICDEAVSALDASIQAQIVELLQSLQRELGIAYLFVAHDLPLVRAFADWIMVFQAGELVEQNTPANIFGSPQHEYTKQLIRSNEKYEIGALTYS